MKVWALFDVEINCGGSCPDSLHLRGLYFSKDDAEAAKVFPDPEDHIIEEWEVQ